VVLNLATGTFVNVGDGEDADTLTVFWKRLRDFKGEIKALTIDMPSTYIGAVVEKLPEAAGVYDRLYIMK
jgi:transposase